MNIAFESQLSPLNQSDFEATWSFLKMTKREGSPNFLAFYNCGPLSGASVPHKHVQFVPLYAQEDGHDLDPFAPIEPLIFSAARSKGIAGPGNSKNGCYDYIILIFFIIGTPFTVPLYPFAHAFTLLMSTSEEKQDEDHRFDKKMPNRLEESLHILITHSFKLAGLDPDRALKEEYYSSSSSSSSSSSFISYNLLFTEKWMLVVPRRLEKANETMNAAGGFGGISINSVAFSGMIRNQTKF